MIIKLENGISINYKEIGNKEGYPLLFLHGNSEDLNTYSFFFNKLSDYKLIFIDSRCHGKSSTGELHYDLMAKDMELL